MVSTAWNMYRFYNEEQGHSHWGPAEGAIGSDVIRAFVAGVMVTAQKRRDTNPFHSDTVINFLVN